MTEPVFFKSERGLTLAEIAALTGAPPPDGATAGLRIFNVAPIDRAGPSDLAFIDRLKYEDALKTTHAGAILTSKRFESRVPQRLVRLTVPNAYRAFVAVATALYPDAMRPTSLYEAEARSAATLIHPSARLEAGVRVDPGAIVGPRAEIGSGTTLGPLTVIGPDVRIGRDCSIAASVTITNALIGDRVIIHPGTRIGQDGFGFLIGAKRHEKIPQTARVIIQDDVEIGANCCVDRGSVRDTVIGEGTKLDNLVQIGHNTTIGRHCLFAGQGAIAGSVVIGDRVMFGGHSGVVDNVTIGEGAVIGMGGVATTDVPAGQTWGGVPARPLREWLRSVVSNRKRMKDDAPVRAKELDE